MDQDSFRSLLAAPSRPGTGRAAGVLGAPALKRGHGGTYGSSSSKYTKHDLAPKKEEKPGLVPRKAKKDGKYKDRAEMRRLGLDDEYKPVEQLLQDFERRAHEGGEDAATIEEQRKYLGGDAEHSILVKGLDYGLLASRKAELEAQNANQYDDELDNLLVGSSSIGGVDNLHEKSSRKGKEKERPKTRDEIVAELKRKRMEGDDDEKRDDIMGVIKKSKNVVQESKAVALPSSKFKSIAKVDQPVETKIKKKKKKIKTVIDDAGLKQKVSSSAADSTSQKVVQEDKPPVKLEEQQLKVEPGRTSNPVLQPSLPVAAITAPESDDEMDGDIFGGVGDYEQDLGSDDDENEEDGVVEEDEAVTGDSPPIISSVATAKDDDQATAQRPRRNWFGDEEEEQETTSHIQESIPDRPPRQVSRSLSPSDDENNDPAQPLQRLQPLSSSALPSAKDLLAADKAAEAADKKQASKARWRAKQGLSKQDGGDDDEEEDRSRGLARQKEERKGEDKMRMNKEAQILESYMAKREKKEKAKA